MKIVVPPVYERDTDPEVTSSDYFKRQVFSENLTKLFKNSDEGLVLSIDAGWGEGKTTFVRKWIVDLDRNEDLIPIYYDAFKNDFTSDAFLSIAASIQKALEVESAKRKIAKSLLGKLKGFTVDVAKNAMALGSEVLISPFLPGGEALATQSVKIIREAMIEAIDSKAEQRLEAHLKAEELVEYYKGALEKILSQEGRNRKIVFFVDELDRCRPDFSMQVIEKIKHLFSVKNVIFVLVFNKHQLLNTVTHLYGIDDAGARVYLQKFIHIETKLPSVQRANGLGTRQINDYIDSLLDAHELSRNLLSYNRSVFAELISEDMLNLNPRQIERVFTTASTVLMMINLEREPASTIMQLFMAAAVKVGNPDFFYSHFKYGKFNGQSVPTRSALEIKFYEMGNSDPHGYNALKSNDIVEYRSLSLICDFIEMLNE